MTRQELFEARLEALVKEFGDLTIEEVVDTLDYQADRFRRRM